MGKDAHYWRDMKIRYAVADTDFPDYDNAVGIDPGRNFGLSTLLNGTLMTYWGKFPKCELSTDYHIMASDFIKEWLPVDLPVQIVMVEGPSYGDMYGQVLLEDVRLGFFMAFKSLGYDVQYVAPLRVRKAIFGNGKIKARDVWLDLPDNNSSDAAAIALYGGGFGDERLLMRILQSNSKSW